MAYTTWLIERIPFEEGEWDTEALEQTQNFRDPTIQLELGDSRDSIGLTVPNPNGKENSLFQTKDLIRIYRGLNKEINELTEDDLLIIGTVKDVERSRDHSSSTFEIDGFNFTDNLLRAVTYVDLESVRIPDGIRQAINAVRQNNPNFSVQWHPDNPDTKTNGELFPVVGKRFFNKPLRKLIEDYSTRDRTQDTTYRYFVDKNNYFVWRPQNADIFGAYTFHSQEDEYNEMSLIMDEDGIRNWIIAKGGTLPNGQQIEIYVPDYASINKHGQQPHILISENNTARVLVALDVGTDNLTTSYPELEEEFTTQWVSSIDKVFDDGTTMVKGERVVIDIGNENANRRAYNNVIRAEVEHRLREEAINFIDYRKHGLLNLTVRVVAGSKPWWLGDRIVCNVPEHSSEPLEMRVQSIRASSVYDEYGLVFDETQEVPR